MSRSQKELLQMGTDKLNALIAEYKDHLLDKASTLSEKQKAALEEQMWELADRDVRKLYGRGDWLKMILGVGSPVEYANRHVLLNGRDSDILWDRVDQQNMPLATSVRLYRQAKKSAKRNRSTIAKALVEILAEYDKLPIAHSAAGKVYRKRRISRLPDIKDIPKKKIEEPGTFWGRLRHEIAAYVSGRLENVSIESHEMELLWRELERNINVVLDEFQYRIHETSKARKIKRQVNRRQLVDACRVLCMDPPSPGAPVNLKVAKDKKRQLLRAYHPDSHGGKEVTRGYFEDVVKAFGVVETYSEQIKTYPQKKTTETEVN